MDDGDPLLNPTAAVSRSHGHAPSLGAMGRRSRRRVGTKSKADGWKAGIGSWTAAPRAKCLSGVYCSSPKRVVQEVGRLGCCLRRESDNSEIHAWSCDLLLPRFAIPSLMSISCRCWLAGILHNYDW